MVDRASWLRGAVPPSKAPFSPAHTVPACSKMSPAAACACGAHGPGFRDTVSTGMRRCPADAAVTSRQGLSTARLAPFKGYSPFEQPGGGWRGSGNV